MQLPGKGSCTLRGYGLPVTGSEARDTEISVYRRGLKEGDGAVDEVGQGLAFELAGSQKGDVY